MDAWDRLRWLFDTDDGGLYDIELTGLDVRGLVAAFEFVRSRSKVTPDATFWHTELGRDEPVADYPDAARLVACGVAEAFQVLASGLEFRGAVIPDLGVFVSPGELTFDYRMSPDWGRPQLLALFELLRQLVDTAGGQVRFGWHTAPEVSRLILGEWEAYCVGRGTPPDASPSATGYS